MSSITDSITTWAVFVMVLVPILIIVAAEADERLRQARSELRRPVRILRNWGLPFLAVVILAVPLLGAPTDSFLVRLGISGLVVSVAMTARSTLGVFVRQLRHRASHGDHQAVPELLLILPRLVIVVATAWILVDTVWGVDLSAALTALGVTSLVISFALQDTLSGLASGVVLLSDRPIEPGHWIRVDDTEGVVLDINWRTTRIRDRNGDVVIVPNSILASSSIINFTATSQLHRVVVPVQVAFRNAPTLAKQMLLDAASSTRGVLADPAPQVLITEVDDPLMGYEVHMWISDYALEPQVRGDFGALVWYQSHRQDVPLPSPAQDLYLYDGEKAGRPEALSTGQLRQILIQSRLLGSLPDVELDRLAHGARAERYAVGELIVNPAQGGGDLIVLDRGHAALIIDDADGEKHVIAELSSGEIAGLMNNSGVSGRSFSVRATTDCDVVTVDSETAGKVASRSRELAGALNRLSAMRRRRAERILQRSVLPTKDQGESA